MAVEKEKLMWMYRTLVRCREFEESLLKEYKAGHIPGFFYFAQGEEAIGVGSIAGLRPDDYVTSTHRTTSGHLLARGEKTERMMAQAFGKETSVNKGRAPTFHFINLDLGHLGLLASGSLGSQLVIACGPALSAKLADTDQVTLCFFGDGVINTGRFHEAVNLASAWKLAVVFICENNTWAESTSIYDTTNLTRLTDRAVGYGIPGVAVDGNDVLAVYEAVSEAIRRARMGEGPTFIEAKTCRWYGHLLEDTQTYRTKEEIDECIKKDPLPRFRKKLMEMAVLTDKEADKIHQEAIEEMDKAIKFALESPFPKPEEVATDVYA